MDISIILPFRNAEKTLERTFQALKSQCYDKGKIEIILIDNGSTDRSLEIAKQFSDVVLLRESNPSIYAARNHGVKTSTGTVLLFTEPGCIAESDWVEQHIISMCKTGAAISVGRLAPIKESRLLSIFNAYESVRDEWNFSSEYWKQYFGRPTNMAIQRKRFESHGPFEQVMRGGDSLLVQKVAREISCDEIVFCPEAVVKQLALHGMPSCLGRRFRDSRIMESLQSSHSAPVSSRDRVALFYETIRKHSYGPLGAAALFFLLNVGVLAWKAGHWLAVLSPTSETEL